MWRDVFLFSCNPEVYLDVDNIRSLLPEIGNGALEIDTQLASLRQSCASCAEGWSTVFSSAETDFYSEVMSAVVEQTAPLAAATGAALQSISAPSVFEDPLHLKLMTLLADDVGVSSAERWRFDTFRDIARSHDLTSVTASLRELADHRGIRDGCFRLAATIYAMSRRSETFDCELIGIDLAWRSVGLSPMWRALRATDARWTKLDMGVSTGAALAEGADAAAFARAIVDQMSHEPVVVKRVTHGIAIFETLVQEFDALVRDIAAAVSDPRLAMGIMVQGRAREARVYHQSFMLDGKPLSDWFDAAQADPMPLVDAIGRSKLVRPDDPDRSLLINGLIREGGAMFRIFTASDIAIMRRWIASLKQHNADRISIRLKPQTTLRLDPRSVKGGDMDLGVFPSDVRSAYYLMQGRVLPPRTREFAQAYCRFWLDQSRGAVDADNRSLPPKWHPGALREWLLTTHETHAAAFDGSNADEIPSCAAVIDQTLQLAPLTLIDGAWLQGFTEVSLAASRVGAPLFETYWDELGNGDWSINHPKVYRDVLAAMDIRLAPTSNQAFAQDVRFRDASFRLPVYWLCLGKLPMSLRPEILGMNLAMELSGVGGGYRNAHVFLEHYGFPTVFVDLHNTIDNVSTGHSAWAADAIDAFMQTTQDLVPPEQSWARIRLGYASLAPIFDDPADLDFFAKAGAGDTTQATGWQYQHAPLQRQEAAE